MCCSLEEGDTFLPFKDLYDKTSDLPWSFLVKKTAKKTKKNHSREYERNERKLAFLKP